MFSLFTYWLYSFSFLKESFALANCPVSSFIFINVFLSCNFFFLCLESAPDKLQGETGC